jgi:hypothetical protein
MGIPFFSKLPKINLFSSSAESSASELANAPRKPRVKKLPIEIVPPPEWVEKIDGYFVSSCKWHDSGRFDGCFVVKYDPNNFLGDWDWGFVKIYAAGGMNEPPFVQMKGIWKEIHDDKRTHSVTYEMSEDGRVYNDMMGFPSDNNINDAIYDISQMYDDWKDFPNAQDWDTVCKLHEAKIAVDNMRVETKYGYAQKNIDEMRQKIKETQDEIARVEKNLNDMYEKAADGMNLLEQYGVNVSLDDEPKEPEKKIDLDFANLYPSDVSLKFKGLAKIIRNLDGSYSVIPSSNDIPNPGEIVNDVDNGLSAVYSMAGKWEVVNV